MLSLCDRYDKNTKQKVAKSILQNISKLEKFNYICGKIS